MHKRIQPHHPPYNKFKGFLTEKELTYADIANLIGRSKTAVVSKVNGSSDFYLGEIKMIKDTYNPPDDVFD